MMSTTRIDELEAELKRREAAVRETELELREAIARHCDEHPLLCMIVDAMIERVRDGKGLCCQSGHDWLLTHVDPIWARVLNAWAYEHLSCSEDRPERIEEFAQLVREALNNGRIQKWVQEGGMS
jgi:hypothetical protein